MSSQPEERSVDSSVLSPVEPEEFVWPPVSADVLEPVETKPTPEFDIPVHAPLTTPSDPLLSDILASDVTFEWHHGVAVVQQLLAQLAPDGPPGGNVPEAWAIRLTSSGELDARLVAGPERPLAGLGTLLHQLLSGRVQPAALRLLVMQATASEPAISLAALREGLAQWERPNRQQSLATLYDEAKGKVTPSLTRVLPMPDLVTRAIAPAPPPAPAEASAKKRGHRSFPAAIILAIAGLGFTAVLIALVLITGTGTPLAPDTSEPSAQADAAAVAESVAEPPAIVPPAPAPAAPAAAANARRPVTPPRASSPPPRAPAPRASTPSVSPAPRPPASQSLAPRPPASQVPPPRPPASQSSAAITATRPAPGTSVVESPVQPAVPDRAPGGSSTLKPPVDYPENTANDPSGPPVYSVSDPGVIPPVALSNLPAQPERSAIPPRLAVLELIIDATGQVEAARFLNPDPHYRDRWWISAAKTWRFQPARLNGQPVRFRARVTFMSGATLDPRVADR